MSDPALVSINHNDTYFVHVTDFCFMMSKCYFILITLTSCPSSLVHNCSNSSTNDGGDYAFCILDGGQELSCCPSSLCKTIWKMLVYLLHWDTSSVHRIVQGHLKVLQGGGGRVQC